MGRWAESDVYSPAEKIAIEYTERFALDHLSLDDAFFDRLRKHFDEGEILELTFIVARHLAFGRMTKVLGLGEVCAIPERLAVRQAVASAAG